jgi:glutamate-5-semialdehyde dehydrogenase
MSHEHQILSRLTPGMPIIYGGDRVVTVSEELAARFQAGDRLLIVHETGDLLHVPAEAHRVASEAVGRARDAFQSMGSVGDDAVTRFFEAFAARLESERVWTEIALANGEDVAKARDAGRSVTRLMATDRMRRDMIAGLREWRDAPSLRGRSVEKVVHDGWTVDLLTAPLGVVGFVFEGRPNVFADATGVLRGGNTVVFRIGSDALGTARAIVAGALRPALAEAGLPAGAVSLVESADRAAGLAMFSDSRLALAVARGSGKAVAQLGSVARQSGIPASLHGTGGAWLVAASDADPERLRAVLAHSLDRKVCNTLNVCCLPRRSPDLHRAFWEALDAAGSRDGRGYKVHVAEGSEAAVPADWFQCRAAVRRAGGVVTEPIAEPLSPERLGHEWEWEETPELSVVLADSVDEAAALFNRYSPQFVASLVSESPEAQERFYESVNAPFVGNGFTRWVDGLYALKKPELGLSNWQFGRLFARGGVLSGDGIYTIRTRMAQSDPNVHR